MFGALAALNPVAAIGSALSIGESALAYKGQKDANASNERIARENRAFQERMANTAMDYQTETIDKAHAYQTEMSNTAYQRSMEDMRSAGLNPILAYQQGGASTPIGQTAPGHSAPGSTANMLNPFQGMSGSPSGVMSTASSVMKQQQEIENLQSQLQNDTEYRNLNRQQQSKIKSEINNIKAHIRQRQAETHGIVSDNERKQIVAEYFRDENRLALLKEFGISGTSALAIIGGYFGADLLGSAMKNASPGSAPRNATPVPKSNYYPNQTFGR